MLDKNTNREHVKTIQYICIVTCDILVVKINTLPWFLNFGIAAISKPFRNQGQCVYFYDLKTHVKCAVPELATRSLLVK